MGIGRFWWLFFLKGLIQKFVHTTIPCLHLLQQKLQSATTEWLETWKYYVLNKFLKLNFGGKSRSSLNFDKIQKIARKYLKKEKLKFNRIFAFAWPRQMWIRRRIGLVNFHKAQFITFPLGDCILLNAGVSVKDLLCAGVENPSPPYILGFQLPLSRILFAASFMMIYMQRHKSTLLHCKGLIVFWWTHKAHQVTNHLLLQIHEWIETMKCTVRSMLIWSEGINWRTLLPKENKIFSHLD